jgi:hypothetical protein
MVCTCEVSTGTKQARLTDSKSDVQSNIRQNGRAPNNIHATGGNVGQMPPRQQW